MFFRKFDWQLLVTELLIVVVGILIAFQIDRWAEERREIALEQEYLERLRDDLLTEIDELKRAHDNAKTRIQAVQFLDQLAADPSVATKTPASVAEALETATWRSFPQINAVVYSELQTTGNLALIRSEDLRRELKVHYRTIDHYAHVGLDREIHTEFDRITAGILTTDELARIELNSWQGGSGQVTADRALAIATELASRSAAIALLPNIAQHNVFNARVIEEAADRASLIVSLIETELAD